MARKKSSRISDFRIYAYIAVIIVLLGIAYVVQTNPIQTVPAPSGQQDQQNSESGMENMEIIPGHFHADFAVYVNGSRLNFSDPRYDVQFAPGAKARFAHLHVTNDDGDSVIHFHAANAQLRWFFQGIGWDLTRECLYTTDDKYCNDGGTLRVLVENGNLTIVENHEEYVPENGDRILIAYGDESVEELKSVMETVTNFSRNYTEP